MRKQTMIINDAHGRQSVIDFIGRLDLSKPLEVTVGLFRKRRTTKQNALMWKWVNEVADHVSDYTGMDADEVHEFFKGKFLSPHVVEIGGEIVEYRTTTKLTTSEMTDYMNRIYAWATTYLGLHLPIPEDLGGEDRP
ncbi:MAG: recombination protein NinB [Alphaproteobacteria bacterium]|nr:recombination protein NinB [Alphaproteobacteria bacterium]